jgi:hypothetical protein
MRLWTESSVGTTRKGQWALHPSLSVILGKVLMPVRLTASKLRSHVVQQPIWQVP